MATKPEEKIEGASAVFSAHLAVPPITCERIHDAVDGVLRARCAKKKNHLEHCKKGEESDCPCSGGGGGGHALTDLVVLIDRSGSMSGAATSVSNAAAAGIAKAKEECPSDLRVVWLAVDSSMPGTTTGPGAGWPGTNFTQSHEQYLTSIGVAGPFFGDAPPAVSFPNEQGADAIADLAKHFDWRKGACRAVFYISDTNLDADWTRTADDVAATTNAINEATANDVTVFAHFIAPFQTDNAAATQQDYQNLCDQTGGVLYVGPVDQNKYTDLLKDAICNACGGCKKVPQPDVKPCISVSWGDSKCECMETDDVEMLCITVCNCYTNITFSDFIINLVYVTDLAGGPVPTLPDGTSSVEVTPIGPLCFGDIGPCKDNEPTCVSRQVVLQTRGAKGGGHQLHLLGICYDVCFHYLAAECFRLDLCPDR